MPDLPIEQSADAAEVETLRRVNAELVAKHARDKQRIEALEAGAAALQAKLSEAGETIKDVTIGVPLKAMAAEMSTVPDLFLEQFSKHFKVESIKGVLTLQTIDGKPVTGKDGKAVPFERQALTDLLTAGDDPRAKTFKTITIVNRASGASNIGAAQQGRRETVDTRPGLQFGLR